MPYVNEASSLGDLIRRSCAHWSHRVAALVPEKSGFRTVCYDELWEAIFRRAGALHTMGLRSGDRLAIVAETGFEWALTDWAAQTLGVVVVPIYPTLPADQSQYIADDAEVKAAVCGSPALAAKLVGPRIALFHPAEDHESLDQLATAARLDRQSWERGIDKIEREDVATIIYTSGTTGNPKGAVLPHRCFLSLIRGIRHTLPVSEQDVFFSFLPLSHVYERFAGHALPYGIGATVGYAGGLASLANDVIAVRPTIMTCVPRFLEAFRGRVLDSVAKAPAVRRALFAAALSQGLTAHRGGFAPLAGVLDGLVGRKIRDRLGGRLRFMVSGGAALPNHVAEFYSALGIKVLQGYGLTETMAATCVNHPDRNRPDTVGEPIQGVEVKIAADGEILIRGDSVMTCYHKLPDATREAIDAEGWFHSGDIGEFDGPYLKITDRKKDLLVLGNGKNVAPQPIENKLKSCDSIAEAVLFGDGMEYVCALIVPDFQRLQRYAEDHGLASRTPDELLREEAVRRLVKGEIDEVNRTLADFEKVKRHELIAAEFTIEGGELTPSMKVRRKVVREKYKDAVGKLLRG
jgi:long-chain acyl-CoA synthetase